MRPHKIFYQLPSCACNLFLDWLSNSFLELSVSQYDFSFNIPYFVPHNQFIKKKKKKKKKKGKIHIKLKPYLTF